MLGTFGREEKGQIMSTKWGHRPQLFFVTWGLEQGFMILRSEFVIVHENLTL